MIKYSLNTKTSKVGEAPRGGLVWGRGAHGVHLNWSAALLPAPGLSAPSSSTKRGTGPWQALKDVPSPRLPLTIHLSHLPRTEQIFKSLLRKR